MLEAGTGAGAAREDEVAGYATREEAVEEYTVGGSGGESKEAP